MKIMSFTGEAGLKKLVQKYATLSYTQLHSTTTQLYSTTFSYHPTTPNYTQPHLTTLSYNPTTSTCSTGVLSSI